MHKKDLGSLGEIAVAKDLIRQGYPCFTELGDNSRIDLIAIVDNVPVKIQVKAKTAGDGAIKISTRKTGPNNYIYRYKETDVDVVAVYSHEYDAIGYISIREFLGNDTNVTFRIVPTKNNQENGVRYLADYSEFQQALRDYTPCTLTCNDEGDEIVQTTT
jgi:hypothetical protein